tara:strand:+ start:1085 stop:1369 length:285 start_codon:yes stop_codon:yes gene_type:complete
MEATEQTAALLIALAESHSHKRVKEPANIWRSSLSRELCPERLCHQAVGAFMGGDFCRARSLSIQSLQRSLGVFNPITKAAVLVEGVQMPELVN